MLCMEISRAALCSMGEALGGDNTMLDTKCYIRWIVKRGSNRVPESCSAESRFTTG